MKLLWGSHSGYYSLKVDGNIIRFKRKKILSFYTSNIYFFGQICFFEINGVFVYGRDTGTGENK